MFASGYCLDYIVFYEMVADFSDGVWHGFG